MKRFNFVVPAKRYHSLKYRYYKCANCRKIYGIKGRRNSENKLHPYRKVIKKGCTLSCGGDLHLIMFPAKEIKDG